MKKILYYLFATIFIIAGLFFTGCGWFATIAGLFMLVTGQGWYGIEFAFLIFWIPGIIAGGSILTTIFFIKKGKKDGKKWIFLKVVWWSLILAWILSIISIFTQFIAISSSWEEYIIAFFFLIVSTLPIFIGTYVLNFVWVHIRWITQKSTKSVKNKENL